MTPLRANPPVATERELLTQYSDDFHGHTPENFDDPHTPVVEEEGHRAPSSPAPAGTVSGGAGQPENRGELLVATVTALDELADQVDALMNSVSVVASRCPDVFAAADLFVEVQRLRGVGRAIRNVRKRLP